VNVRAIIFDIYGTLLEVGPPPAEADTLWELLWQDQVKCPAPSSLAQFSAACDRIIAREHEAARARGIPHPEVFWPDVAGEALPELGALPDSARDDFFFHQAQLWHTVRLPTAATETLRTLGQSSLLLGIASNAQPYTLRELDEALAGSSLFRALFKPALCFWSFEHGFSKPDPHVFRLLTMRLRAFGIPPTETLMVGDRLDHDIEPARAQGWQTWWLSPPARANQGGGWAELAQRLSSGLQ